MPTPRQIVPPADFVARGAVPVPAAPPAQLTNHGGKVIGSVEVVPIYWGAAWATGTNALLASQLDGYFDFITTSSVIDLLAEYSIPGTAISHGQRLTSVHIPGNEPGTVTPSGRQVTDDQIRQAIQGWIADTTLPANTDNTLYFVYLPPDVSCIGPGGTGASCSQFCGYHDFFNGNIYYAVIPYVTCNGCVFSGNFLDTLTEVATHELCEAITDPTLSTWWDPNTGDEIGDICNRQTARLGNYLVQTEWSNEQNACVIAPLFTQARRVIDGYATTFNDQQHVNFVGADNHVHELYYDNEWHLNDLTQLAGAPAAAAGSALDGYETAFNSQQHVNFVGTDNHVHELWYDNAWHHNDLSAITNAPPVAVGGAIDGYATTFNNQQHVNFVGADGHVHELYDNNGWHHNDLTQITGAPPVGAGGRTDGYATDFNNQQHVNFTGPDQHVHELYYDGSQWRHDDLTLITGAPLVAPGGYVDGYETAFNSQQHVNFVGADNHVHELWYDNAWHHNDLSAITNAPPVAAGGAIDGYATTFNNQQHVNFVGADGHVHELYYDNGWHHNDLTAITSAPLVAPGSAIDGYQTAFNSQQHVNFVGVDNHVHELWYDSAWHHNDLTLLT